MDVRGAVYRLMVQSFNLKGLYSRSEREKVEENCHNYKYHCYAYRMNLICLWNFFI
jgi:hypothetical protein